MRSKPKSIRSKIIISLVVPVVALSALWGFNVHTTVTDAFALRDAYSSGDQVGWPSDVMLQALQAERTRSQEFLAITPRNAAPLLAQRAATDAAVTEFRRRSAKYHGQGLSAEVTRTNIADMIAKLDDLPRIRAKIDTGGVSRAEALNGYNTLIGYAFSVLAAASAFSDLTVDQIMRTVMDIRRAAELLSQEDSLMTGAATAHRFDNGDYLQFIKIVGALRFQIPTAGSTLPKVYQTTYFGMVTNPTFVALHAAEDKIIRDGHAGGPTPIALDAWKAIFTPALKQIYDYITAGYDISMATARDAGNRILMRFSLAGGLGLFAILLSLFLSIRIGRSVVDRLSLLRAAATDLATRQLPDVVARLRRGEQVNVEDHALRPPPGDDEIAEVGFALGEVQRSAIDSAVGEAALRYGMSKVFVNIARRNQTLIDRQLRALAQLPATTAGEPSRPAAQAEQLALRMRRHAEHLVILAGSARSRGGLRPVPLAEIVGNAASDMEDGERVEILSIVDAEVPGRAATDIVHLLAELLENATAFSPPDTPVRVSAQRVPHGVAVEIEDRGLGMSRSAIEETNRTMAQPPDFDPANSARLGLFVVAQLAAQRGIRVSLQPSSFGGITAVVLLPPDLVEVSAQAAPSPPGRSAPAAHRRDDSAATPEPVSAGQSPLSRGVLLDSGGDATATSRRGNPLPRRKPAPDSAPPLG